MSFRCQAQVNNSKSEGSVTNAQTGQDPSVSEKRKDEEKKKKKEKKAKGNSEEDKDESTTNGVGVDSAVITNSEVSCHSSVSEFNVIKVLYSP